VAGLHEGVIVATTNGGKTWAEKALPAADVGGVLWGVSCATVSRCWVVPGYPDGVLATTDGGSSWSLGPPLYPCPNGCFGYSAAAVDFANSSDGWIAASSQCGVPRTTSCPGAI